MECNKQTNSDAGMRAALKMAIEYLECPAQGGQKLLVIQACKEALAQTAQEPVATVRSYNGLVGFHANQKQINILKDKHEHPLYLHPAPSWQGLSDDDVRRLQFEYGKSLDDYYVAIEQALKDKNT